MTDVLYVQWTLEPKTPPQPIRHCASCGVTRPFQSSGKVRLNANGKRLDAWLIYKCLVCDRTWNRTILERVKLQDIAESELHAMEHSAPYWVRRHENDLAVLKQPCDAITLCNDLKVTKPAKPQLDAVPRSIELTILTVAPTGLRLDRLLSRELALSRSRLKALHAAGELKIRPDRKRPFGNKISSDVTVVLNTGTLKESEVAPVLSGFFDTR